MTQSYASILAVGAALLSFAPSLPATRILDFNIPAATPVDVDFGNYDGTSRTYNLQTGSHWRFNFDTSDTGQFYKNPWSTCTSQIPWFYGGLEARALNDTHDVNLFSWRQGNVGIRKVDFFAFDATGNPDAGFSMDGLFLWRQDQFINGGAAGAKLDANSSLAIHYNDFRGDIPGSQLRFVLQSNGQYYLSEFVHTVFIWDGETITLNDPGSGNWALFNPTATDFQPTGSEVFDQSLTGATITQVGIYFYCGRPQYAGGWSFDIFTVDAALDSPTPLPPPLVSANLTPNGADLSMSFVGAVGKVYSLRQSDNLVDWAPTGLQLTGDGTPAAFTVAKPTIGGMFYHVARQD